MKQVTVPKNPTAATVARLQREHDKEQDDARKAMILEAMKAVMTELDAKAEAKAAKAAKPSEAEAVAAEQDAAAEAPQDAPVEEPVGPVAFPAETPEEALAQREAEARAELEAVSGPNPGRADLSRPAARVDATNEARSRRQREERTAPGGRQPRRPAAKPAEDLGACVALCPTYPDADGNPMRCTRKASVVHGGLHVCGQHRRMAESGKSFPVAVATAVA